MSVEIENASINSVQVSINVVKIGQKQMTQAVFNQLYEEKPWDSYYNITEFLWGKVKHKGTDYIVFQSENELKKCAIPKKRETFSFMVYFRKNVFLEFDDLWLIREINSQRPKSEIYQNSLEKIDKEFKKIKRGGYMDAKFGSDFSLGDFEQVLEKNLYEKISHKAKSDKWWDEKYNSLVNELHSQKQLFIAV